MWNMWIMFLVCAVPSIFVFFCSVLTLKALAKDWKASLLLLNLALCCHQCKLTEHAERDVLASEEVCFGKNGHGAQRSCCRNCWNIRLRSKSLQCHFTWQVFKWRFSVCSSHYKNIIKLSKGLSHITAASLDTLNSSTKLSSMWIFLKVPVLHTGCAHLPAYYICTLLCFCSWLFDHTDLHYLTCLPLIFHLVENVKLSDSAGYFHCVCEPTKRFLSVLW